jgi:hypothetical protein
MVCSIVDNYPDKKTSRGFFAKLAKFPSYKVRSAVAAKDQLDEETVNFLANCTEKEILSSLLRSDSARACLTTKQLVGFIEKDAELASEIVDRLDSFKTADSDELATMMMTHSDSAVRYSLANAYETPKAILRKLAKDTDPDVARAADARLKDE